MSGKTPLLAAKGVYVRDRVVSSHFVNELLEAMKTGVSQPARVSSAGISTLDLSHRNSRTILVDPAIVDRAFDMFEVLRPDLERFFAVKFGSSQHPVFIRYDPGHYFRLHCDNAGDPQQPTHIRARLVSAVLFLNSARTDNYVPEWDGEPNL